MFLELPLTSMKNIKASVLLLSALICFGLFLKSGGPDDVKNYKQAEFDQFLNEIRKVDFLNSLHIDFENCKYIQKISIGMRAISCRINGENNLPLELSWEGSGWIYKGEKYKVNEWNIEAIAQEFTKKNRRLVVFRGKDNKRYISVTLSYCKSCL